jgi:hypothetical protein
VAGRREVGYNFAAAAKLFGYCSELFFAEWFDARLSGRADGGVKLNLVGSDTGYGIPEFGNLLIISIKTIDEKNLEPDLACELAAKGTQT